MRVAVIIPAAGSSSRYRAASPLADADAARSKVDEDLGGRPVLQRAVELFTARDDIAAIIVAGPHDDAAFAAFQLRHADRLSMLGVTLCRGGKTHRYETVAAALAHAPADATHIAVHDAARPVTSPALIDRLFLAAQQHPAVIPGVELPDTLKRLDPSPLADAGPADPLAAILGAPSPTATARRVAATVDRTNLVAVQTPQVFDAALLRRAYAQSNLDSTDDAGLVERLGHPVLVIEGDPLNIKITRPADTRLARVIGGFKEPEERAAHKRF